MCGYKLHYTNIIILEHARRGHYCGVLHKIFDSL